MMLTKPAIIIPADRPGGWRKAEVELDGQKVGFCLDRQDHPYLPPGSDVQVEFDPQDQFARITES